MTSLEARNAAVALLKDEANELACMGLTPAWKDLPHRAKVAIQNEIQRLRDVAEKLKAEPDVEDESELERWSDAIRGKLVELCGDDTIDGGGCDSGDPLDVVLAEIDQAFSRHNVKGHASPEHAPKIDHTASSASHEPTCCIFRLILKRVTCA